MGDSRYLHSAIYPDHQSHIQSLVYPFLHDCAAASLELFENLRQILLDGLLNLLVLLIMPLLLAVMLAVILVLLLAPRIAITLLMMWSTRVLLLVTLLLSILLPMLLLWVMLLTVWLRAMFFIGVVVRNKVLGHLWRSTL